MTPRVRNVVLGLVALVLCVVALLANGGLEGGSTVPQSPSPAAATTTARPVQSTPPARDAESGLALVPLRSLPAQVATTVDLIEAGGPFPYGKDGVTFGNRERILPRKPSGFYREYTVPTPGSADRGARRVVTGDRGRQLFYSGDHYETFVRIRR